DPNPPVPREIFNQWWAIERHRAEWPLRIDPGRVDPADPSVVTIALRFGGTDGTATLRLTDADTLTFSSTIGWAESIFQKWWLGAPEQDLATLMEKPELIP